MIQRLQIANLFAVVLTHLVVFDLFVLQSIMVNSTSILSDGQRKLLQGHISKCTIRIISPYQLQPTTQLELFKFAKF